jgi:exopolysaccharide production protein ExoQ
VRQVITLGFVAFVAYLFWRDVRGREGRSISWMPLVWMFLAGSRWVSSWFNLGTPLQSVDAYSEGSPVDRLVFLSLIVWGAIVLWRRSIDWQRLCADNWWIVLYFSYCLSSIIWTDEPLILIKRWIKDLGNPIVALVMLTEARPYEALGATMRRLAFLLLPFSVMFVRYYPDLGRSYKADGSPMYTGVGHQKNDLGSMCLIAGIYLFWKMLQRRRSQGNAVETIDRYDVLLIGMLVYLLRLSDSQTSLFCLVMSIALMGLLRISFVARQPSRVIVTVAAGVLVFVGLDSTLQLRDRVFTLLGRDPSLTNRTELWQVVQAQETNSVIGAGFMSFWAGDRMQAIWDALGGGINQAHNGYLEQYLNLGYIGVGFIIVMMLIALFKIRRTLDVAPSEGTLRLCLLATAAMFNYTEASFYGINNMWVLLLATCIDVSGIRQSVGGTNEQPAPALTVVSSRWSGPKREAAHRLHGSAATAVRRR